MRTTSMAGFATIALLALCGSASANGTEAGAAAPGAAGAVSCRVKAWGEPYPSVIVLKRLAPECEAACVQVIRTNGEAYPKQCVSFKDGTLTIGTRTGDYHLAVGGQSLHGDFTSTVNAAYSRKALDWACDRSPALVTDNSRAAKAR
ncbi:MAG TPA: hypothetical protein VJR70_08055 [Stellaceae bacterium]|nr:hypothetical protein [Stellaceae bacterium]